MAKREPASVRMRESLSDLIERRLSSAGGRAALIKPATRLIVEGALETESRDVLGRDYYEHGASPGRGWRNGVRIGHLKTAEGLVDYAAPQIAGRVEVIETCFPRSARQRCLAHRLRNLAAKVPDDLQPGFKARASAAYQAPSRAIARDLATGVLADYQAELPSATACFMDHFGACIVHLRMPITHSRAIRTTNLLKRLFVEERRRLKFIPNALGEKPALKLMLGAMIRAAERWRAIRISELERRRRGVRPRIRDPERSR